MGTNYYLHEKPDCECCGRPFEAMHIGKSSAGWCFSLHIIPENGINTLEDWRKRWNAPSAYIRNEYGERVSVAELEAIITERRSDKDWNNPRWWQIFYSSEQDFHAKNYSARGPHGLLRHRIGEYCNGHGDGTWDYIAGDFS